MSGELYKRLKEMKSGRVSRPGDAGRPVGAHRSSREPSGTDGSAVPRPPGSEWGQETPYVWSRILRRKLPEVGQLRELLAGGRRPFWIPRGTKSEQLLFWDIETTGLSGGAGTVAFLIGLGRLEKESLVTEQLFLGDYPGEPELLHALSARVHSGDVWVSYNGKAFDANIMRTRFLLSRIEPVEGIHLDLLYPARRLWRSVTGRCTLSDLEERILSRGRQGDIPGWEIPEAYFAYLHHGEPDRLCAVFNHHARDIESLVALLALMERLALSGTRITVPVDLFELGRLLVERFCSGEQEELGESILRELYRAGGKDQALSAGFYLARRYRRGGQWERAREIWEEIYRRQRSITAGVELAKYYEHRSRDYRLALDVVQEALVWPHAASFRASLQHRKERLVRKLARLG